MMNRRLVVSQTDRKIAGVCGGLAEYFDLKASNLRLAFIVCALLGGSSILIYIILALIMAER